MRARAGFGMIVGAAVLSALAIPAHGGLIVNGDFEVGNTGFSTQYTFGSLLPPRRYNILSNPRAGHPQATSFGDHTSGSGLMMVVNGSEQADVTVWSQTVPVSPGTNYSFSTWVASWTTGPTEGQALLDFSINGSSLGTFRAPTAPGVWQQFMATWDTGSATSANIRIVDLNSGINVLNDFALDDISLAAVPEPASIVMLGTGGLALLGLAWVRRRRPTA